MGWGYKSSKNIIRNIVECCFRWYIYDSTYTKQAYDLRIVNVTSGIELLAARLQKPIPDIIYSDDDCEQGNEPNHRFTNFNGRISFSIVKGFIVNFNPVCLL